MNEFIEQFLIEARELVDQASDDLLALEAAPGDRDRLDSAFRAFHTLKGAAGIIDFAAMARALHMAEHGLDAVRGGSRTLTSELVGDCLAALDQVQLWLGVIAATGEPPAEAQAEAAADALIARFGGSASAPVGPADSVTQPDPDGPDAERRILETQILMLQAAGAQGLPGRLTSAARVARSVLTELGRSTAGIDAALARSLDSADSEPLLAALRAAITEPAAAEVEAVQAAEPAVRALRVDVERVDALVRLTGEITVVKTAIGHLVELAEGGADPAGLATRLKAEHAQFERLVGELQHAVLGIRVLPLRQVFQRFPRLVRELGVQLGKPVRLVTEGDDTEADKAIVETLFEPLLHVLRNAVDHGVEVPAVRDASGKPAIATIVLRGARRGEHVTIEVEDDGGGIDLDRVRAVAETRGVASSEILAAMTDEAAAQLVFAPGFSTAATVSDLSGRGVGMDAVRATVERLGGRASVETRRGTGTTVRLTLPFTVMMTRVLTVEAGGQVFGIPFDAVVETIRIARRLIAPVGAARALVLRDRTIPVIDLSETLGATAAGPAPAEPIVVIVDIAGQRVGLEVERIGEPMEVMLKPLGGLLAGTAGVSGATLLGDGRVLLVLDLPELVS